MAAETQVNERYLRDFTLRPVVREVKGIDGPIQKVMTAVVLEMEVVMVVGSFGYSRTFTRQFDTLEEAEIELHRNLGAGTPAHPAEGLADQLREAIADRDAARAERDTARNALAMLQTVHDDVVAERNALRMAQIVPGDDAERSAEWKPMRCAFCGELIEDCGGECAGARAQLAAAEDADDDAERNAAASIIRAECEVLEQLAAALLPETRKVHGYAISNLREVARQLTSPVKRRPAGRTLVEYASEELDDGEAYDAECAAAGEPVGPPPPKAASGRSGAFTGGRG